MLETVKREWQSVDLPKALFKRVKEIINKTGNVSVAETSCRMGLRVRECLNKRWVLIKPVRTALSSSAAVY